MGTLAPRWNDAGADGSYTFVAVGTQSPEMSDPVLQRTIVSFWRHPDIKLYRVLIGVASAFLMWSVFVVYMLWAWQAIPSLPPGIYWYAGVYYIFYIPIVFINLLVPCQRIDTLYVLGFLFNLLTWVMAWWLWWIAMAQLWWCYWGTTPAGNCKQFQVIWWIMLFINFWIWLFQTVAFFMYCIIVAGVHQLRKVRTIYT